MTPLILEFLYIPSAPFFCTSLKLYFKKIKLYINMFFCSVSMIDDDGNVDIENKNNIKKIF